MPFLYVIFFISTVQAVTISKIMSAPEGTSVQTYKIVKGKGILERKTNVFGPINDLRLGTFSAKKNLSSVENKITNLISKDKKKADASKIGHQIFFKVNNRIVEPGTPLHRSLELEFATLQTTEWDFTSGVEISADLSEMKEVVNGKVTEKKLFPVNFFCDPAGKGKTCTFKNQGVLYVQ